MKGMWSQFSCHDWFRLCANSWKKEWDWLKIENAKMLTRSSRRQSSCWRENSCRMPRIKKEKAESANAKGEQVSFSSSRQCQCREWSCRPTRASNNMGTRAEDSRSFFSSLQTSFEVNIDIYLHSLRQWPYQASESPVGQERFCV